MSVHRRFRAVQVTLLCALFAIACDDGADVTAPESVVTGTVINAVNGDPVAGAVVSIGDVSTTSDASGHFELSGIAPGTATIAGSAVGFQDFESAMEVRSGDTPFNVALIRIEHFEFGTFALFVPAHVTTVRGVVLALGGPDTRAFATGKAFGAPIPEVESSLRTMGIQLRSLAATHGLAIIGTSQAAMANGAQQDQALLQALKTAGETSGRRELESAPILFYGLSGGAPEASGFTARNPARVVGLFLKVPADVSSVTSGPGLLIPTYMVQAELDAFIDNAAIAAQFETNRKAGALWAMARELRVVHHSLSPAQRQLTIDWMRSVLDMRLPLSTGALRPVTEAAGWLGNPATGLASSWAAYSGDRMAASWFPDQPTAQQWQGFIK